MVSHELHPLWMEDSDPRKRAGNVCSRRELHVSIGNGDRGEVMAIGLELAQTLLLIVIIHLLFDQRWKDDEK